MGAMSPIKLPPLKKRKQNEPKCLFPSDKTENTLVSGTRLNTESPSGPSISDKPITVAITAASQKDGLPIIRTVNLSSILNTDAAGILNASTPKEASDLAVNEALSLQQVPKEPPVIPDKLPATVLIKITNLEQVRESVIDKEGVATNDINVI